MCVPRLCYSQAAFTTARLGFVYRSGRGQSSEAPGAEGRHYCVDENTERRNHYLDLAGIENYTSRFEGKRCHVAARHFPLLSTTDASDAERNCKTVRQTQLLSTSHVSSSSFRNQPCCSILPGASRPELPEPEPLALPGARHLLCSPAPLTGHQRQLQPCRAPRQGRAVPQIAKGGLPGRRREWRRRRRRRRQSG